MRAATMAFELENPLTFFKEHQPEIVPSLFANESFRLSSDARDSLAAVRRHATSRILQARVGNNIDEFVPFLAIDYVDRFISKHEIPQDKPWLPQLVAVACLSLSAKMRNVDLSLSTIQNGEGLVFDAKTMNRMELLILNTLQWRMRSITPFSFLSYFLSLFEIEDQIEFRDVRATAKEIIFRSQLRIEVLEFKPSVIAASALLCAAQATVPARFDRFRSAISSSGNVDEGKLLECIGVLQEEDEIDG